MVSLLLTKMVPEYHKHFLLHNRNKHVFIVLSLYYGNMRLTVMRILPPLKSLSSSPVRMMLRS